MLIRLSNPEGFVVTLEDLKVRLRVDFADDDDDLKQMLRGQTVRYEDFTGRYMLPIDLEFRCSGWGGEIALPVTPIREVTSVTYLDGDDSSQVLPSDEWYYEPRNTGGAIRFNSDFSSPALSDKANPVRVLLSAGYDEPPVSGSGDDPDLEALPSDALNIMAMVRLLYDENELMTETTMRHRMANRRVFR